MKQRVSMGSGQQAIIVTNLDFDDEGFVANQRAGILPFDPEKDAAEMLETAAKYVWELFGLKNIQGFYSVRKKRELTPEERQRQTVALTGRSIINDITEEKVTVSSGTHETNTASRVNQDPLILH